MAGSRLPIIPKRQFDFSNLAVGTTQTLIVQERFDISQYIDCMIALRVHSFALPSGNTLRFDVFGDGYTRDDPTLTFRTAVPLFTSTSLPIFSTDPQNLTTYGGTIRGHYAQVVATATKTQPGALAATVSLDMILRTPDETALRR